MSSGPSQTVAVVAGLATSLINFREHLLRELIAAGYRVVALAPADAAVAARLMSFGVEFVPIRLTRASLNPFVDIRSLFELVRVLKKIKADIVFSYTIKPVIYGSLAARFLGIRPVVTLITGLGYAFTGRASWRRRVSRIIATRLYRLALRGARCVLFQNADDAALFREFGIVTKSTNVVCVNGSGVDLDHFQVCSLPGETSFLMIARLVKDKGVFEYVEAARRLRVLAPSVRCRLAGPLDENPTSISHAQLQEWVAEGTIDYLGNLTDVRPALEGCSVYVLPSYREGMPRTVLEAMSMRRAVITTDVPGCRQSISPGETGILVPPQDVESLVAAMLRFVREPGLADAMAQQARRRAEIMFDVRVVTNEIIEAIRAAASSSTAANVTDAAIS